MHTELIERSLFCAPCAFFFSRSFRCYCSWNCAGSSIFSSCGISKIYPFFPFKEYLFSELEKPHRKDDEDSKKEALLNHQILFWVEKTRESPNQKLLPGAAGRPPYSAGSLDSCTQIIISVPSDLQVVDLR